MTTYWQLHWNTTGDLRYRQSNVLNNSCERHLVTEYLCEMGSLFHKFDLHTGCSTTREHLSAANPQKIKTPADIEIHQSQIRSCSRPEPLWGFCLLQVRGHGSRGTKVPDRRPTTQFRSERWLHIERASSAAQPQDRLLRSVNSSSHLLLLSLILLFVVSSNVHRLTQKCL